MSQSNLIKSLVLSCRRVVRGGAVGFGLALLSASPVMATPYSVWASLGASEADASTSDIQTSAVSSPEATPDVMSPSDAAPSQRSIQEVVSYYYGAEGLPILADYKLCAEIGRVGADRNNCIGEISADSLVQGQVVYLWMNYLVPKGTQTELLLHYNHQGITRDASHFKVSGSIRYRTWKKIKLSRSGTWELPIYVEQAGAYTALDRINLQVQDDRFAGR